MFEKIWANPAYRFVLLFGAYLGIQAAVYPLLTKRYFVIVQTMTEATAKLVYWLLLPFSESVDLTVTTIRLGSFSVQIIEECTGVFEVIIFSAAVLAYPTSDAKKAIGLALGIPILYLFNVLRILMLLPVGDNYPELFEFMHLYFWQGTLILMITSVWLLWIFKVVRYEKKPASSPA